MSISRPRSGRSCYRGITGVRPRLSHNRGKKPFSTICLRKTSKPIAQLYQTALQRGKEASIDSALRSANVRVVDPARPKGSPYKPRVLVNLILGLLGGCFAGVGLVLARDYLNRSIRVPGESTSYLNVPELGVIPSSSIESNLPLAGRIQRLIPSSSGSDSKNGGSSRKRLITRGGTGHVESETIPARRIV